ncbi:MAG: hypothetical protein GWP15_01980 [Nitrospirae bacterium]|nr:hypothetical protein [Nitrospirota bacterium]
MNIAKIIRVYFVFTMMVASIAVLSYNDGFEDYILSVMHANGNAVNASNITPLVDFQSGMKEFSSKNESSSLLTFKFVNDPYNGFVAPGTEGAELMGIYFKAGSETVILKDLKLKLEGIEPEFIEKAYITDGQDILKVGSSFGEYYSFNNINEIIDPNHYRTLYLLVDLSEDVHTGERFRMDIESPDDIVLFTGIDPFSIDEYYPIKGKYLSVAVAR